MEQIKKSKGHDAQSASTRAGHQVRTNKIEFVLVENELLHFPRNETDELLPELLASLP